MDEISTARNPPADIRPLAADPPRDTSPNDWTSDSLRPLLLHCCPDIRRLRDIHRLLDIRLLTDIRQLPDILLRPRDIHHRSLRSY
jgi:hypothetical protein